MKKLTIATLISTALSTMAFAGDDMEKIASSFANLDKDGNGYVSRAEAKDSDIFAHFTRIDKNADTQLSMKEFDAHIERYPQHRRILLHLLHLHSHLVFPAHCPP